MHGHLPASVAHRFEAFGLHGDGQQCGRCLLAGGGQHVQLTMIGRGAARGSQLFGQAQQAVGFTTHGAGHHHHLVACPRPFGHALGDVLDALCRAHRCAAVFMNDQCHGIFGVTKLFSITAQDGLKAVLARRRFVQKS
ncbi:hypothetical protein SDC9_118688 [bioreactor metagenome]|uniref:Uncharacterized protein n=1 Tax=bioreactor metagenome TaxID=1076179 RepID=A0A645C2Y6_9ZZZZ